MPDAVDIPVRGHSMRPTLLDGSTVVVDLGATPRSGDVVLFMNGDIAILHRLLAIRGGRALTQGDGAPRPDPAFDAKWILGVARMPRRRFYALARLAAESLRALARRSRRLALSR